MHTTHHLPAAVFLTLALSPTQAQNTEEYTWAMPAASEVHLRLTPSHSAEMVSQALPGTPMKVIGQCDEWVQVRCPDDYEGWVNTSSLITLPDSAMRSWRATPRLVVTSLQPSPVYTDTLAPCDTSIITRLVNGSIVEGNKNSQTTWIPVKMSEKVSGWMKCHDVEDFEQWASQPFDSDKIILTAKSLMGDPYMWGGTTTRGVDCSGLVRVAFFSNAMTMPRDASQQALMGEPRDPHNDVMLPCDLLFFANDRGSIVHVAISEGNDMIIHSSGFVKENSLDTANPVFIHRTPHHFIDIRKAIADGTVRRLCHHPWYFNNE